MAIEALAAAELLAEVRGPVATVTLNRPSALNALSWDMVLGLRDLLERWAADDGVRVVVMRGAGGKAFCAGGDIRMFWRHFQGKGHVEHEFFTIEYALDFRIHTYPKPIVAIIDGVVMGGGMGLAQGATLRVVGDRTRMAMPETAIGLFPDVGGSYFLSRTPGAIGNYLGLAGATIGAADALHAGLADVDLSAAAIARLDVWIAKAAGAADPRAAIEALASRDERAQLQPGEVEALREAIDRHFDASTVEAIIASLRDETGHREWAERIRAAMGDETIAANGPVLSPLSLKVTLEQLRRGRAMPLADCFRMELGLVRAALDHTDFFEGIRALLIDKDRRPRWDPPRLADVSGEHLERFFQPRWAPARHPLSHL
jgi:enoyl-CoA hydratase